MGTTTASSTTTMLGERRGGTLTGSLGLNWAAFCAHASLICSQLTHLSLVSVAFCVGVPCSGQLIRGAPEVGPCAVCSCWPQVLGNQGSVSPNPLPCSGSLQDGSDDEEGKDKIGSLFQKAKAIGAQQGTADDLPTSGAFGGQARTLGGSSAQVCAALRPCNCPAVALFHSANCLARASSTRRRAPSSHIVLVPAAN